MGYIDGELPEKERGLFETHAATCQHCRTEVKVLTSLQDELRDLFRLEADRYSPSPLVWQRLQRYVTRSKRALPISERISRITLFPRQLGWKTRLISVLAVVMIIILAITIPLLFKQSNTALAADIALHSPEVQALIVDRDVEELEVVDIIPNGPDYFIVVLQLSNEFMIGTYVNIVTETVTQVDLVEFTDEKKQQLISTIKSDPRVESLLEQGAKINDFQMGYTPEPINIYASPGSIFAVTFEENNLKIFGQFILAVMIELEDITKQLMKGWRYIGAACGLDVLFLVIYGFIAGAMVDPASLALFFFTWMYLFTLLAFILNAFSRWREKKADLYSLKLVGNFMAYKSGFLRLAKTALSYPFPSKLEIILDYSHPPIKDRIKYGKEAIDQLRE